MPNRAKQKSTKQDKPAWYHAVIAELSRLTGHWKQEPCILGIIDAETKGEGWDRPSFWSQPDKPNRNTFYKWVKQDAVFVAVLENCRTAVRTYRREAAIAAIDEAEMIIQEASPQAARKLVDHIDAEDDGDSIRASNSILDRASKSTANKQPDTTIRLPSVAEALEKIYGDIDADQAAGPRHHEDEAAA